MASESWSRFLMLRVAGTETWGSPVLKVEVTLLRIAQPEQWIVRPHPSELRECAQRERDRRLSLMFHDHLVRSLGAFRSDHHSLVMKFWRSSGMKNLLAKTVCARFEEPVKESID